MRSMYFESTCVGESPQHFCILNDVANSPSVILLIEKISCFLSILQVYPKLKIVFTDNDPGIEWVGKEPFLLRHALQFPYRHIVPFIDACRCKNLPDRFHNGRLPSVDPECKCLYNEMIIEFIDDKLR